jgi:hypothetical protein
MVIVTYLIQTLRWRATYLEMRWGNKKDLPSRELNVLIVFKIVSEKLATLASKIMIKKCKSPHLLEIQILVLRKKFHKLTQNL